MKTIALLHTVKPVLNNFSKLLRSALTEDVIIYDIYDDFLAIDPTNLGYFSKTNKKRLYNDIENCSLTGADMIVVTCSTLSPIVQELRTFFDVPIIAIDDAMCEEAISSGSNIRVLATAKSTIQPTIKKLKEEALKQGKDVEIVSSDYPVAYEAMKSGNLELHDKLLCDILKDIEGFDVIVLAQASMAHLAQMGSKLSNIKTLGSIDSCIEYVTKKIEGK
jgi:Asp/Glu/hydantoin racemase